MRRIGAKDPENIQQSEERKKRGGRNLALALIERNEKRGGHLPEKQERGPQREFGRSGIQVDVILRTRSFQKEKAVSLQLDVEKKREGFRVAWVHKGNTFNRQSSREKKGAQWSIVWASGAEISIRRAGGREKT